MKQNHFLVLAVVAMAVLTSCSTGRYVNNSLNMNMNQTQVVLSTNNFRVVKTVSAYVEYKETLRFDYKQLQQNAYAELIRKANLQGSQMLVNVTLENVQRASMNLFGFIKYQNGIMAQGVVIEFCDPSMVNVPQNVVYDEQPEIQPYEQPLSSTAYNELEDLTIEQWNDQKEYPSSNVYYKIIKYCDNNHDGQLSRTEVNNVNIAAVKA